MICLVKTIRSFAAIHRKGNAVFLQVHVRPNSKCNSILEVNGDYVRVGIKAAPVEGQANAALVEYLSGVL